MTSCLLSIVGYNYAVIHMQLASPSSYIVIDLLLFKAYTVIDTIYYIAVAMLICS